MKAISVLGFALPLVSAKVSYDGYKAFHIQTPDDFDDVAASLANIKHVSMSCESNHKGFDVAIAPESLKDFEALGLKHKVIVEDLGADIATEGDFKPYVATSKIEGVAAALPDIAYFDSYHEFQEHLDFIDDLAAAFPEHSETFSAGESLEGRNLKGIHLYGADGPGTKPAIVWHGNVHAREWITSMTVEYMTYQLIAGYQNGDQTPVSTLDSYDFYIMPIVNPDGFVYTQTDDRMWRKNRQERDGESCAGTDINRNWPYKWDIAGGSSPDPCDETYRGEEAGDTPENQALVNHTLAVSEAHGLKFYVDWHSYSQLILLPYGYSCSAEAPNLDSQMDLAAGVAEAIQSVNGLEFVYGPTCETIYQTAGGSNDWVQDIAEAELAWAFELRPTPSDGGGFVIPPSNIVPSGEEIWAGMLQLFSAF